MNFAVLAASILPMAVEDPDGFHGPSINEFFPTAIFGGGTFFEFNRIMLVRVIVAMFFILLFMWLIRNPKLIPSRRQSLGEMAYDFIDGHIARDMLGAEGKKHVPMLFTIFFGVLFFNLAGIIPGLNIAGTGRIGLPLLFALWVYVAYLADGIRAHGGVGKFFKNQLVPPGMPLWLYPLITPIEALQVLLLRPLTLALRLAMNMVAGHILLVLCFSATHFFFFQAEGLMKSMGAVSLLAGFVFTLFELLVAVLQAYVFALLAAAYIQMSISTDH